MTFPNKQKLKEFMTLRPTPQGMLTGGPQAEVKECWTVIKTKQYGEMKNTGKSNHLGKYKTFYCTFNIIIALWVYNSSSVLYMI